MVRDGPIERAIQAALTSRERRLNASEQLRPEHTTEMTHVTPTIDTRKHRKVQVVKISDRCEVVKWMSEEFDRYGKNLMVKTVQRYAQYFKGSMNSNLSKAVSWWRQKERLMLIKGSEGRQGHFSGETRRSKKRVHFKAMNGRGRKRAGCVQSLYNVLLPEFERLRTLGVKFSANNLMMLAIALMETADEDEAHSASREISGVRIVEKVKIRWIQQFMKVHNIVVRAQTGSLLTSPAKKAYIEKSVAFHLGTLKRAFDAGLLNEDRVENADETHFIFNMDNGKKLWFKGECHVKYADVVSGGDSITMMVRITGGRNATIETPMLIFKNERRSYPIRSVPDNIPGVTYRSGPKGWMDREVFIEWLSEPRAIKALPSNQQRVLFVDNCSGHNVEPATREKLRNIRTTLQKFPPNSTHLIQPADSFIIQKIKCAWRKRWDEYKRRCIENNLWTLGSGKLPNPGKAFYLKLAATAIRDVNSQRDKDGLTYARKAMIVTGMSLNVTGVWEEKQLTNDLQIIVAKYRNHINGLEVEAEDGYVSEEI